MIRFACPRCGMQLSSPEDCAGRSSNCGACGQAFQIPGPAVPPVTAPSLPPVRCQCPRCKQILEASVAHAGKKTNCPKCGQRLQLPAAPAGPPLNKTILAPMVEGEPPLPQMVPPSMVKVASAPLPPPQPVAEGSSPVLSPSWDARCLGVALGVLAGCILGFFAAHHFALYGGLFLIGAPYSVARYQLVPGHMLLLSLLFGALGFGIGWAADRNSSSWRRWRHVVADTLLAVIIVAIIVVVGTAFALKFDAEQKLKQVIRQQRR